MRVLFIRHTIAVEREEYEGDDLSRPLTKKGISRAKKAFRSLSSLYPHIDAIISSRAVRSIHTAEILNKFYKKARLEKTDLLNPGVDYPEFLRLFHSMDRKLESIAFVGHEPDLSEIISGLLIHQGADEDYHGSLPLVLKKASCTEMEYHVFNKRWTLHAVLPPRVLRNNKF